MSSLVSRVLVSVVGLPIVLVLVWAGGWWTFALAVAAALIGLHEFAAAARPLRPLVLAAQLGVVGALLGAQLGGIDWMGAGFLVVFPVAFALFVVADTRAPATVALATTVLAAAWVGFGLAHLILLRDPARHGVLATFTVVLAVFAGDIAAYFAGRLLGRHRLAPRLSPGKTWEGLVAGTIATIFVAFVALYKQHFLTIGESIVLGAVLAVAAPVGDLFESALKRDLGVKDTGRILAAHGGILDRIDALLFALPAGYYVIRAFGGI